MPSENLKAKAMAGSPLATDGEKRSGRKTNVFPDLQKTITDTEILRSLGNDIVKVRNKKDILTFILLSSDFSLIRTIYLFVFLMQ